AAVADGTEGDAETEGGRERRPERSAPTSENRMIGSCCRNASSPRKNAEFVSDSTSQFCATICIHVPMLEVQAPNHCTRKSRYVKAASVRRSVRAPSDDAEAVSVVAVACAWTGSKVAVGFRLSAVSAES